MITLASELWFARKPPTVEANVTWALWAASISVFAVLLVGFRRNAARLGWLAGD